MGQITSKFLKLAKENDNEASETQNVKPSTSQTPKTSTEPNEFHESDPLKTKLLRTLKLDPRSPTVGIYRTPILVEEPKLDKRLNFDSPISVYSCNINDSLVQDVMTPIEPSVNVSGFENSLSIVDNTLELQNINKPEKKLNGLRIVDKPNTYEARRLLDEMMADEENFVQKVKVTKKAKKPEISVSDEKKIVEVKGQLKTRIPLSNITSSANSPNQTVPTGKIFPQNKIMPEIGCENSASPKVKHLVQWDQNNTVII